RPLFLVRAPPVVMNLRTRPDSRKSVIGCERALIAVTDRPDISRWYELRIAAIHFYARASTTMVPKLAEAIRPPVVDALMAPPVKATRKSTTRPPSNPSRCALL